MACSKPCAPMDVWMISLAFALDLDAMYLDQMCVPRTGGRYLSTIQYCQPQTSHNVFKHTNQGSSGFIFL